MNPGEVTADVLPPPAGRAQPPAEPQGPRLGPARKSVYALGDVTLNTALSCLSLIYATYFLTQVAGLRPVLAGLVPLVARAVDAVTDPLMGRISDRTTWRGGRRRPYLLLGALPFGVLFALLWIEPAFAGQGARFAYYTAIYCLFAVAMTVLSVPYLALQPEMALGYDARTSLNTYRTVGSIVGVFCAVAMEPAAVALGGGARGFATAGLLYGVAMAVPWLAVHRATFERPGLHSEALDEDFVHGLRTAWANRSFQRLTTIYIMGRIAMDLAGALIILYVTYWLGRREDFAIVMAVFLGAVMIALPGWLAFARGREKVHVFVAGSVWWMATSLGLVLFQPDWPRELVFGYVALVGLGYAVVDVMPWSMLGEVIDEDEVRTGQRREGLYHGFFTFVRKLGGALGVFLVLSLLDLFGFRQGEQQDETARQAIRWMAGLAPAVFLAVGVWATRGYPLTRARHDEILVELAHRHGTAPPSP